MDRQIHTPGGQVSHLVTRMFFLLYLRMGTGSHSRNWPYEWAQEAPAETEQSTEAHYFSTLLAGYQQAATRHNSFYCNILHKRKDIPVPAETPF